MILFFCPKCQWTTEQPSWVREVVHQCPKQQKKYVALKQEQPDEQE